MSKEKIYALYKGDSFIAMGTKKELADYLGVTIRTISFYSTPTYQKRYNYKGWVVIRIEDDTDG